MPKNNKFLTDKVVLQQKLAELVAETTSLAGFTESTFELLLSGTPINNTALILYDAEKSIVSYTYTKGFKENMGTRALQNINSPLKAVIESKESLSVKALDFLSYCNDKSAVNSIPVQWSGFPVMHGEQLFAVILFIANNETAGNVIEELFPVFKSFSQIFSPYLELKIRLDTLEGSEVKFRRLVETSIDITFQITKTGYIDYISSNVETLFGCSPEGLVGKHFKVTTPMNQVSKVIDALKSICAGKTIRNLGITQKVATGSLIPMEVSASPIHRDGVIIGAQGTMRDISERQQAQQEIERLAFFPLSNPMPVVEVDLYGVPSYINPAGIQLLDRMNLDMAQVSQILPSTFKQDIRTALSDKGQIMSREISLEGMHFLWNAFFLQKQNLIHFYATDITNLKDTENQLIQAKEHAIKNEQVKTMFLANMSHEIRTPLNSILGFTELIEEEVKSKFDADLQAYFEIIHVSGKRLWQTVHEILDISQIETGTFELKIETIDLSRILKELGISFRSKAQDKNLDLLVNVPNSEMQIAADEYCVTHALTNLIDNAIKYTNSGYVKINTEIHHDTIKVIIKDTGIGMSDEYQQRMFNAFSQESTGYTKHFQGVGLGLALAHRYLKLVKSDLELSSEQDVGSIFTITFPTSPKGKTASQPLVVETPEKVASENQSEQVVRYNVLVVEDDPNSQKLAGFTLKKDFELFFAESVAEAKDHLASHDIQMILLDLSLKGDEDGLDLARFLRSEAKWQDVPIIALTAHAFTSDRDRCMDAGCNEFMTKPFRRLELLEAINSLI